MKKLILFFSIILGPTFAGAGDSSGLVLSGYVPVQADIRIIVNDSGKIEMNNFSSSQLRIEKVQTASRMPASVRVIAP